jgi:CRISPR-associated endonuclease/helicase Cas3
MLDIVPFEQCIARPDDKNKIHLLSEHLIGVKNAIEKRLSFTYKCQDSVLLKVTGLAGLCHDIAKAHVEWQKYIRGKRKRGPNHAPEGAFFFSYLGYYLLKKENKWKEYAVIWLWLIRDIADHHGHLKSLNENHWIGAGAWDKMDLQGIKKFICNYYIELNKIVLSAEALDQWTEEIFEIIEEVTDKLDLGYSFVSYGILMSRLSRWRKLTTALVAGDRFHIIPTNITKFQKEDYVRINKIIDNFCRGNSKQSMSKIRSDAQRKILFQLRQESKRQIYTLEMPTGYGKTITAMKIAAWFGKEQGYEKIIYVAPYLSILEQTSNVVENVLNMHVLEHHSLAIRETKIMKPVDENDELNSGQLIMESWANSIVCTSFQQWCKAIFPEKAQDTLRRSFLENSIVIIDEPQIFAAESWNVFLCGLESLADIYNLRVIFLSATMPPFEYGFTKQTQPGLLAVTPVKHVERYKLEKKREMDEQELADFLLSRPERLQAAILNTITDAYLVYKSLASKINPVNLKLLHGMMIPLHKRLEIKKIKHFQEKQVEELLYVVSTQIIEAGVDLSFEHIVRALPILPSIIQAAGRVNRNFSEAMGTLTSSLFLREGKKNTRGFIYPQKLVKLTDELLQQKEVWFESELLKLIKDYYKLMFEHNSYEAGKQAIADAYEGNWPALGQFKPFGEDYYKLPIFVPWQSKEEDKIYFPKKFTELQCRFQLFLPEAIYECYTDRDFYSKLLFQERKEFMILMNHYVVNVPAKLAFSLVDKELYLQNKIPILLNSDDYDPIAGLAKRNFEGVEQFI